MAKATETSTTDSTLGVVVNPPVLLDLGEHKPKRVKQLRKGKGKLLDEITTTIDELKSNGVISASAQPVIIVVREKVTVKGLFPMLDR